LKRRLALVLAGAAGLSTFGLGGAAYAKATITTPLGSGNVGSGGITLDGNSGNPNRLAGYVIIHSDGSVSCDSTGGPYNDDGSDRVDDPSTPQDEGFHDPGTCSPS